MRLQVCQTILLGDLNDPGIVGEEEITIGEFLDGDYDHSFFEEQKGPVMT